MYKIRRNLTSFFLIIRTIYLFILGALFFPFRIYISQNSICYHLTDTKRCIFKKFHAKFRRSVIQINFLRFRFHNNDNTDMVIESLMLKHESHPAGT